MTTFTFTSPDGKSYEVAGPEGATQEQAWKVLQGQIASGTAQPAEPAKPSGAQRLGALLNDIPRQVGLTARYALEGGARAAELFTEPARYVTDRATGMTGQTTPLSVQATKLADTIGLPTPSNDLERVVGEGTKMGFGAMLGTGAAGAADKVIQAGRGAVIGAEPTIAAQLAANPAAQVSGAVGSGVAGQASKEAGGTPGAQMVSAALGGVAGGLTPDAIKRGTTAVASMFRRPEMAQQLDVQITNALAQQGIDFSQLSQSVRDQMRQDAARAIRGGGQLDNAALGRLAAFREAGMTPTRSMISQNPIDVTREQNLAKIAANTQSGAASELPGLLNANNARALGNLNELGAASGRLPVDAGRAVQGAVVGRAQDLRSAEQAAWDAAKASPGYRQAIYPDALSAMNRALDDEGLMGFMSPQISAYMRQMQETPERFTPQAYKNLQSMLAGELSKGGNEAAAARVARTALEATPMRPIVNPRGIDFGTAPVTAQTAAALRAHDAQPTNSMDLIDAARGATRRAYQYEDSNSLVRAALHRDADPTSIARRFVIGGSPDQARQVAAELGPQGRALVREALMTEIRSKATGGATDATANVSASGLRGAINSIGEEKLGLFFSPEEIRRLRSTSLATDLMLNQPRGSAVNNSNTAGTLMGRGIDALDRWGSRVPLLGTLAPVPQMVRATVMNRAAQDVAPGLLAYAPKQGASLAPVVIPAGLALPGLLAPSQ